MPGLRIKIKFVCPNCVREYKPERRRQIFCSNECYRAYAAIPATVRFWSKVNKADGCWLWMAGSNQGGYGLFHQTKDRRVVAHRFSWEEANGPVPDGLVVCHDCPGGDNPLCVNPAHLYLGTQADNNADCKAKGRLRSPPIRRGESHHNSKLTGEMVCAIRQRHAAGERIVDLARDFPVGRTNISLIVNRRTWARIE